MIAAPAWTALSLLVACAGHRLPTATIQVDGKPMVVEIADSADERSLGLMYRDSLPPDEGMLFVYTDERERRFWMKDTKIPLSIAYADRHGVIVHIADMRPLSTAEVPSELPAMYALEVNQGWFAAHDVQEGDKLGDLPAAEPPKE